MKDRHPPALKWLYVGIVVIVCLVLEMLGLKISIIFTQSHHGLHNSNMKCLNLSAMPGHLPSSLAVVDTPNLNMKTLYYILFSAVLGLVLAIPSNTCIVIVNLETIRKEGKLIPSDGIFLAKGIVNVLLQSLMSLKGILFSLQMEGFLTREVNPPVMVLTYFLTYYGFWLTAWLSTHYWTSITNLSSGFFIWIKRVVSHFLRWILLLTALGLVPVTVPINWAFQTPSHIQPSENITVGAYFVYYVPMTFLGCILPFCLSLLSLLLTVSFLVRHVWRVKNNDSGSTRPNLQTHVTALRTVLFLLFMFTSFSLSQVLVMIKNRSEGTDYLNWTLALLSPSVEAAVIFQASKKVKAAIQRRFWTGRGLNTET